MPRKHAGTHTHSLRLRIIAKLSTLTVCRESERETLMGNNVHDRGGREGESCIRNSMITNSIPGGPAPPGDRL